MTSRNALYAQSGGVTAVINATACGVIETVRKNANHIGTVFAAENGILGALHENLIDTASLSDSDVASLKFTPGGAFGSCRFKLKSLDENRHQYERLIEVLSAHDIGYLFYNGGNDSADTALKVSQLGDQLGYPVHCIGVPKTIDNDLPVTDTCPGFGSVAKYVATSIMEAGFDVAAMAETSTKVFVMEVMGRHAGWIAAAAGVAARNPAEPPHIILFPEVVFDEQQFVDQVAATVAAHEYCTIVVSEGVRDQQGRFLSDSGLRDAFGHAQLGGVAPVIANLVTEKLGFKHHWAVLDYLQRSARHLASQTDLDQAYAVGQAAVEMAVAGSNAVMPVIERISENPYQWRIAEAKLEDIANVEKVMPAEFIREDGFGITEACRRYIEPLIQGEAYPPYVDGLPGYRRLSVSTVARKLPAFEP
jgi:6-phosphofructokinase 1